MTIAKIDLDVLPSVVREIFFRADGLTDFSTALRTRTVAAGGAARFMFATPQDFASVVSLDLLMQPAATNAVANIDLLSQYGAIGASVISLSTSNNAILYSLVATQIKALDIVSVFPALAAGQNCGILIQHNAIGGTAEYFGVRLRYNTL